MLLAIRGSVHDIEALMQSGEQSWDLLRRILQVVVDGYDDLVPRSPNAAEKGVVLPVVPAEAESPHPGITAGELLDELPGVIATAVLDEDDLERGAPRRKDGEQTAVEFDERSR